MRSVHPVLVVGLLLAACTDAAPVTAPRSTPSPETTDFISGGECPLADHPELPDNAGCMTSAEGTSGTLVVYALIGEDSMPESWRIRLETDIGAIDQRLVAGNRYSYPRAIGPADVNGDGRDEWWIKAVDLTGHGTAWQRTNVFTQVLDGLEPVTFEGEIFQINVGGISRMGEGARCEGGRLVLLRAEAQNVRNTRWRYSERSYEIVGTRARFVERDEGTLRLSDYNDPDLDPFYALDCNGLSYP